MPDIVNRTQEFKAAVAILRRGGIPHEADVGLMNRAVTRGEPLEKWADHLVRVKTQGAKVWSS